MKLLGLSFLLALCLLFAHSVLAANPLKNVIVSYNEHVPDDVMLDAKKQIQAAGGVITHEFNVIKAFVANSPAKALDAVRNMGQQYDVVVEDDLPVMTWGSGTGT